MPSLSGLHMCRTISTGHSSRSSSSISSSSGSRFLAKSRSDFKLRFNVFLVIIAGTSLCVVKPRLVSASRTLSVSSGRNSRMSATMPTSATWKIGALGFLLMATMNGLPLSPARCWNEPLMPQAR